MTVIEGIRMGENAQPKHSGDNGAGEVPDAGSPEELPAGGAGADSGAVEVAGIDADDHADVQNISNQNDIPGVGTRAADGSMEKGQPREHVEAGEGSQTDATSEDHDPTARPDGGEQGRDDDSRRLIQEFEPGVDLDSAN